MKKVWKVLLAVAVVGSAALLLTTVATASAETGSGVACEAKVESMRPMWQRVASLGLLSPTVVDHREVRFSVSKSEFLKHEKGALADNKDLMNVTATYMQLLTPDVLRYVASCTGADGQVLSKSIYERDLKKSVKNKLQKL